MRFVDNPQAAVLAAAKDMLRRGLVEGTAGNISARREDGNLVITPSSVDYSDMALDDLVVVNADGDVVHAADVHEGAALKRGELLSPASTQWNLR